MAERPGFEPGVALRGYNGLAIHRFRPLSHLSAVALLYHSEGGNAMKSTEQRGIGLGTGTDDRVGDRDTIVMSELTRLRTCRLPHALQFRRRLICLTALPRKGLERTCGAGGKQMPFLLFTSSGRTGRINSNGSGLHYFDFKDAGQVTWQPGPLLQDGRRTVFLSMEKRRDGPGKPFAEYYTQTPTHLWVYDFAKKTLTEICTKDRLAVFYTPALLLRDERILVQVVKNGVGQILSMKMDGSDARDFTKAGRGIAIWGLA